MIIMVGYSARVKALMGIGGSLFNLPFLVTLDVKDLALDVVEHVGCYSQNYSGSTGLVD